MIRWLLTAAAVVLTLVLGASLGLATAFLAVRGEPPFGAVRSGPWRAWPGAAGPGADPYARAIAARDGRVPLPTGAGVRFMADRDSAGHKLFGRCRYTVSGSTPPAQAWTLTLLDPSGVVASRPPGRDGFTSAELVRDLDGSFVVTVAASAQPGNWLPNRGAERFALMLNLYDTPLGTALMMGAAPPALPRIAAGPCA